MAKLKPVLSIKVKRKPKPVPLTDKIKVEPTARKNKVFDPSQREVDAAVSDFLNGGGVKKKLPDQIVAIQFQVAPKKPKFIYEE